jgi:hypothetical protein
MRLLFCSSNPDGDLDLVSELETVLDQVSPRHWYVDYIHNVTLEELARKVRSFRPDIVHFCRHSDADELVFCQPGTGAATSVSPVKSATSSA